MLGLLCIGCPEASWWISQGYAADSRMYRWIDKGGAVHYSDQIPPAYIEQGHIKLSEEGVRVESIAPAPTEEELRAAQEQERLKEEEARRIEQEKVTNQQLLKSFRTIEDLILAREGKVAAVEALSQTTRDGIRFEQRRLRELHKKAAEQERTGKPVAKPLQDEITKAERLVREGYATILENEFHKEAIHQDFDQIMTRYRRLRKLPESSDTTRKRASSSLAGNLVSCNSSERCIKDWEKAMAYVRAQADTGEEITGPGLLITAQRDEREDRLLTLVWIQKTPEEPVFLFLDLQCKNRLTANLTCTNQAALNVRDGFRAAVSRGAGG